MRQVNLSANQFQHKRRIAGFEGGAVYAAEAEGKFYLIKDASTMADFLDEEEDADLIANLIQVYEFDDEGERNHYLQERGWQR